ncbi:hypothetical protein TKK_0017107 [Trichogramma kaykai]
MSWVHFGFAVDEVESAKSLLVEAMTNAKDVFYAKFGYPVEDADGCDLNSFFAAAAEYLRTRPNTFSRGYFDEFPATVFGTARGVQETQLGGNKEGRPHVQLRPLLQSLPSQQQISEDL